MEFDRDHTFPEIVMGTGACPPEDCGGIHGFHLFKDYLSGKMSKEEYFKLFLAVDDQGFDVHEFDLELAQERIREVWHVMERLQ